MPDRLPSEEYVALRNAWLPAAYAAKAPPSTVRVTLLVGCRRDVEA